MGAGLLVLCIAGELGTVYGNVRLAVAQAHVFDAVQEKQAPAFLTAIEIFLATALVVVFVSTYRIYVRNILHVRWREGLTDYFLSQWIGPHAYAHRELFRNETDNPDQRIAQDVDTYVASALGLSLSLLSAIATLISFAGILWTLSGRWPLRVGHAEFEIPGLMMWVAVFYALLATWLTHRIGRPLTSINFDRLRFEADFRYGLVHFRDHVQAVELTHGEEVERQCSLRRFAAVVHNWWQLITTQRNVTLLTSGIGQANGIVPLLVAAPAYFAGRMTLGSVTETGIAYGQVSGALSWFVDAYQEIAQWRASIERLATFCESLDAARLATTRDAGIHVVPEPTPELRLVHLSLAEPDGEVMAADLNGAVEAGERVALIGPPGRFRSILFSALAGIWPFGTGRINMPAQSRPLFLAHQPYLPIGMLRDAIVYPSPPGTFTDEQIGDALRLFDLGHLVARLDDSETWEEQLSGDEQQRLTLARAILHEPDWLIMDDATGLLDEATEKAVYETLGARLPHTTLLSITNRPALAQYHQRKWELGRGTPGAVQSA
jgi:putative ATP-binding cassette transporter